MSSYLQTYNGKQKLLVDGSPFTILSVQLNCDSCFNLGTIETLMENAYRLGCNSVALLLYWRIYEKEEGKFDNTILNDFIITAEKWNLKIVLVWFGAFKNGCLNYAPNWIQNDFTRFQRVIRANGTEAANVLCPNHEEILEKDTTAVKHIFQYLKDNDSKGTVILFQVDNETGIFCSTTRCHCTECEKRYWAGNYEDQYGKRAEEAFMAESFSAYCESIAKAAKEIYSIPCYVNAWLALDTAHSLPGFTYPSGGPAETILDVYLQNKHHLDFVSPDIYETGYRDFNKYCKIYSQENNPLYIAELGVGKNSRSFKNIYYGICEYGSLGVDLWAIDCAYPDVLEEPPVDFKSGKWSDEAYLIQSSFIPLRDANKLVSMYSGTDQLKYWVQEESEHRKTLTFGDVQVEVDFCNSTYGESRGAVIQLTEKEYVILGFKSKVTFYRNGVPLPIKSSVCGKYNGDEFKAERENIICFLENRYKVLIKEPSVSYTVLM